MQGMQVFEYAVIRLVPKVEREEFINVGVILYCREQHFLQTLYFLDPRKLEVMAPKVDPDELESNLLAFCRICEGTPESGPIGKLPLPERFRWLTAVRSTILQASRPHPGLCSDAESTLKHLFNQLVLG